VSPSDAEAIAEVIPEAIGDVTPAWLSAVLGGEVTGVRATDIGAGSAVFATVARLELDRAEPGRLPTSVVVKLVSPFPAQRDACRTYGFYEREVRFYEALAGDLPVRVPASYHAAMADGGDPFVLVLEDLRDARIPDQVAGVAVGDVARALDVLAGLHARWWASAELATCAWLPAMDVPFYKAAGEHIGAVLPEFRARYDGRVPDAAVAAMARLQPVWAEHLDRRVAATASRTTVIHYDPRADNLLFTPDGELCLIDWQLAARYTGAFDVAYACAHNLTVADRRAHEADLLRRYHGRLVELGVDVGLAELEDDYRASMLQLCVGMVVAASFEAATDRARALLDAMTERAAVAVAHLDAVEFL
jgi:aminoglycoside phosphotransferase (APT) family kinase protein